MAQLNVKGRQFNYPDPGREPGWGEDATAWAEAITEAVETAVAAGDLRGEVTLPPQSPTPLAIPGVQISSLQSSAGKVLYHLTEGSNYQSGVLTLTKLSNDWLITREYVGDNIDISFQITSSGQITYTSTAAGSVSFKYRFITVEE